ncbi:hypothetical protein FRC02_003898 [Tulasnella sp. 418]|nr:hypothetical protein FRC02_003898 [Tulasnella sp. 418]
MTPLKSLIYGIRRYDLDRCLALNAALGEDSVEPSKVCGFISQQSKVYLADVYDHIEYVLSSLEMFQSTTENLIGFSFNVLSYDMNHIMRRLTLATILFLPLNFLTSYFGMNFQVMSSIEGSDLLFWKIAIPCTVALVLMFSWKDVKKFGQYISAKNKSRNVRKAHSLLKSK